MNKKLKIASAAVAVVMAGTMAFGMFGCNSGNGDNGGSNVVAPKLDENNKLTWASGTTLNINVGNQNSTAPQSPSFGENYEISGNTYLPDGKQYGAGSLKPAWAALQTQLGITLNDTFQNLGSSDQITTPITNKNLGNYDVITGSLQAINENSGSFLNLTDYLDYMPNYKAFLEANPVTRYSLTGDQDGGMYAAPYFDGNDDIEKYSMMNHNWVKAILDTEFVADGTFKAQADAKKAKGDYTNLVVSNAASATAYMGTTGSYTVETTDPSGTPNAQGVYPTTTLKVNYDAAHTAAVGTSALATAITDAAGGTAYTGASGNIVDLMNHAINTKQGEVTGAQLAKILREYIKVAYQKADGSQFYTKLSDVFLSASAGWDVDLLVAISRCVVASGASLPNAQAAVNVFAIAGRETTTQRRVDLNALAGELYGVRGLESRFEYTYFDSTGHIQDTRADASSYELLNNFSKLTKEGLVYIGTADMVEKFKQVKVEQEKEGDTPKTDEDGRPLFKANDLTKSKEQGGYGCTVKMASIDGVAKDGFYDGDKLVADIQGYLLDSNGNKQHDSWDKASVKTNQSGVQTFMLHDYVQTQTAVGITGKTETNPDVYNFAPVVNAVSKWDVDGNSNNGHETIMRFTESWRSVKNTGFCVPKSITGNTDKLSAVLAFIDYFFSSDGQLLMTYGPQSTTGNTNPNGWWYAEEAASTVTLATVADKVADATNYAPAQYKMKDAYKSQYFVYNEHVYVGFDYNGTKVPEMTTLSKNLYLGKTITVGGTNVALQDDNLRVSAKGNYTNFARKIIGSTLPIGNKNQGFEYQCTATVGLSGAATVTKALLNGTLKHVKLTLDEGESPWYLIAPTALPLSTQDQGILKNSDQTKISGTYFYNNSKTNQTTNIYIDILFYGLGSSANICGDSALGNYTTNNTGAKIVALLNSGKFNERLGVFENGWYTVNEYYNLGYDLD